MTQTALGTIYFVAFSHALMMAVSLYRRTSTGGSGRLLAILVLIMGYKLFEGGALYTGLYHSLAHSMDLLPAAALFFGPVFFLYVCKVTGNHPAALKFWPAHFIPGLALWLYSSPSVWQAHEAKVAMWDYVLTSSGISSLPAPIVTLLIAIKIHLGIYLWVSWTSIKRLESASANLRADNSQVVLFRLRLTTMALFGLEAIWVGLFLAQQLAGIGTLGTVSDIWLLFVAFFILSLGYIGLQNPGLLFEQEEQKLAANSLPQPEEIATAEGHHEDAKVKYLHSALPESTLNVLAEELEKQLKEQQLYLDDKLSLTKLAKITEIRSHTLSQVINQSMQTNFYKLINSYRVQHAVSLIDDIKVDWPLERIALESGFSNRVTFVKAFKEVMDCTPSAYKKQKALAPTDKTAG